MISTRPVQPGEWKRYRDLRLQALRDSPEAFSSTYASEAARADEVWAARIDAAAGLISDQALLAFKDGEACGMVWGKRSSSDPALVEIFQMWVAPSARGLGVGRALLSESIAWAQRLGVQRVGLTVTTSAASAVALYRASGFVALGVTEPLREGSTLHSQAMELQLKSS